MTANRAQSHIDPFTSTLESLGGHRICDDGDAGIGSDNLTPWYEVYYLVPLGGSTASALKQLPSATGTRCD